MKLEKVKKKLLYPAVFYKRDEILKKRKTCPVPNEGGWYAWYFKECPPKLETGRCYKYRHPSYGNRTLLYVGISPEKPESKGTIRKRLKSHMKGNAYGSTLRLLGCLLGFELRRVSEQRLTFVDKEMQLSDWLQQNAYVTWCKGKEPWRLEDMLIRDLFLPLNLECNKSHPFYPTLHRIRENAKRKARELPPLRMKEHRWIG